MSPVLKQRCEDIASEVIKRAEVLGFNRREYEDYEKRQQNIIKAIKGGAWTGMDGLVDPRPGLKERKDELDKEEAAILDLIVSVVECERGK
jgi:hypothetical protein